MNPTLIRRRLARDRAKTLGRRARRKAKMANFSLIRARLYHSPAAMCAAIDRRRINGRDR